MTLRDICNTLFDKYTGLPPKDVFLKKHVVPANDDDKYYNNKCALCWDEYNTEHPAAKLLPCGHVFGSGCVHEMVKGPTGDLCPVCRTKLFRRNLTPNIVILAFVLVLRQALLAYFATVTRVQSALHQAIGSLVEQYPWLNLPVSLIFDGPQPWAKSFVSQCTDICSRNPSLDLHTAFASLTLMTQLLHVGHLSAPVLLPIYFVFGIGGSKVALTLLDLIVSVVTHWVLWTYGPVRFDNDADRKTITCVVAFTLVLKELMILGILYPASNVPVLRFAWTVLATAVWR